jgi:hypothetical protein
MTGMGGRIGSNQAAVIGQRRTAVGRWLQPRGRSLEPMNRSRATRPFASPAEEAEPLSRRSAGIHARAASDGQQSSFAKTSRSRPPSPFSDLFCRLETGSGGPQRPVFNQRAGMDARAPTAGTRLRRTHLRVGLVSVWCFTRRAPSCFRQNKSKAGVNLTDEPTGFQERWRQAFAHRIPMVRQRLAHWRRRANVPEHFHAANSTAIRSHP